MFSSSAQISKPSDDQKPGWYSLCIDKQIADYYKWFYSRAFKNWNSPMNGCHLTFIAGEKDDRIIDSSEIRPYLNQDFVFYYANQVWSNGRAFWLPAYSPELDLVRVELGLQPRFLYHVTLGNIK